MKKGVQKTYHATKQMEKRKLQDVEIEHVLEKGRVKRMHLDGSVVIELGELVVVKSKDNYIITAFRKKPHPTAYASRQHWKGRRPEGRWKN